MNTFLGNITKLSYKNNNLELNINDTDYLVKVLAIATHWHLPGRRYLSNGDPGYQEEDIFEITYVDAVWFSVDENKNKTETTPTYEMTEALNEYLNDLEMVDWVKETSEQSA